MKTSTEIRSIAWLVGEEKAVEYVAKAGFDAWDFTMQEMCHFDRVTRCFLKSDHPTAGPDYLAFARKLKQVGLDHGIVCNQSHAPFPVSIPEIRDHLKRAIECTAEAGGKICVIHPDNNATPEKNAEMYQELLPFAKEYGVKLATENMWNWDKKIDQAQPAACGTPESFCAHIDVVGDEDLVACLDIGHAEMRGAVGAVEMIKALGSRLQAVHLHDNDRWHDHHQIPFSEQVDFVAVMQALKEIGYPGDLTLEAYGFMKSYTPDTAFEGVCALAAAVNKLKHIFINS